MFSVAFFIWNFFNERKLLILSISFLVIIALLNIFRITVIIPANEWSEKVQAEWDKTGYDPKYLGNAQESINFMNRAIENYKYKNGIYPNSLNDIQEVIIINLDLSYRVKQADGQTDGVPFYYEKIAPDKFYLTGVGKDGVIKTDDDLLPQISKEQEKNTGLTKYVIKSFSPEEIKREKEVYEMWKKARKIGNLFD